MRHRRPRRRAGRATGISVAATPAQCLLPYAQHASAHGDGAAQALFQRLFGQGDTAERRKRLAHQYSSVLDLVSSEAADLQRSLGAQDKAMLNDYLDTVREIERRVQKMEAHDLSHVTIPEAPAGTPTAFEQHITLMFDMVALAYQANMTRIFSFMMAAEVSGLTYNQIGVSDAFHPLSHHNNEQAKMDKLVKIQTYHTDILAKFLSKLDKMPDGDGSMLDHSPHHVRQQHEQQQRAQSLPAADRPGGRLEERQGRSAPDGGRPDAAGEYAAHDPRPRRSADGFVRRQLG